MLLTDFDYYLPPELIAEHPLAKRSDSRLLCLDKKTGKITHLHFRDLPNLLTSKDLVILNNTKVIPARIYARKPTGGAVEILLERILDKNKILAQTKACKPLKIHEKLIISSDIWFEITSRQDSLFELLLHSFSEDTIENILDKFGHVPLPPYIKHTPENNDKENYQTIYAQHPGAVAAPTAGLHFDQELIQNLNKKGVNTAFVTLHVGLGTFQPVRATNITDHKMHAEYINVPKTTCEQIINTKSAGGKIIAVGTTSVRALETATQEGEFKPYKGDTNIFIYPGYKFCGTDMLITNFHLPKTSLLMLVCAFAGYDNVIRAYQEAIKHKYRFYSYGDAMIIGNF